MSFSGKAAVPMTQAVEEILGDRTSGGMVVTKTNHGGPTRRVAVRVAQHPVPDKAGVDAGRRILHVAHQAGADDLVIALISGGSALLVVPAEDISLADLQAMTGALLACGATINEINCLRKHCSAVKGGQLARATAPATLLTLVLSDVVGSPLDVIGSGPPCPTPAPGPMPGPSWSAMGWRTHCRTPLSPVCADAGLAGDLPDTPKPNDPAFARSRTVVIADNRVAALAALAKARKAGSTHNC
ncbi:MAG: glycerate-2-kinase family protein [Caldilineaceae bacterium]